MEEMVAPRKERETVNATPYGEPSERGLEGLGASVTRGRACGGCAMSPLFLRCYRIPRADVVWSNEPYVAEKGRNESGLKWRLTSKANLLYSNSSVEHCLPASGMRPGELTTVPTKQTHRYPFYMSLHPPSRPAPPALPDSVLGTTCFCLEAWILTL